MKYLFSSIKAIYLIFIWFLYKIPIFLYEIIECPWVRSSVLTKCSKSYNDLSFLCKNIEFCFVFFCYKNKRNILNYTNALCLNDKPFHICCWYFGYLSHWTLHFFLDKLDSPWTPQGIIWTGFRSSISFNVAVSSYNHHLVSYVADD